MLYLVISGQIYRLIFVILSRCLAFLRLRDVGRAQVSISDLPEEILSEVFLHLDSHGVLAVKQTCKAFYQTTKSRQLWYKFVKELQAEQVRRPEEPPEEYSTRELEKWVLRRLQSRAMWNPPISPVVHQHPLRGFGSGVFAYCCILPGGRWLLVLMYGEVYTVDLDAPQLETRRLFNSGNYTKEGRLDKMSECCHWMDNTKSRLSFRVGLCGAMLTVGSDRFTFTRIALYQVELKGHGSDATLIAEPLASMRSLGRGSRPQICLNAEYFVEFLCCSHSNGDERTTSYHLRSYRYHTDGILQEDVKPFVLPIEGFVRYMDFISDNRIVAFDPCGLHIYVISPFENDVEHAISSLYTISSPSSLSFSPLHRTSHATFRMVVFSDDEVRGVEIPDRDPSATVITKLGHQEYHWRTGARAAVGLSVGVVVHGNGTMDLLSYSWGKGKDITFGRKSCSVGLDSSETVVLTEDLARIVVNERRSTTLIELDSDGTPS